MPSIFPVELSITITAPLLLPSALYAAFCKVVSSVVYTLCPFALSPVKSLVSDQIYYPSQITDNNSLLTQFPSSVLELYPMTWSKSFFCGYTLVSVPSSAVSVVASTVPSEAYISPLTTLSA